MTWAYTVIIFYSHNLWVLLAKILKEWSISFFKSRKILVNTCYCTCSRYIFAGVNA